MTTPITSPVQVPHLTAYSGGRLAEHLKRAGLTPETVAPLVQVSAQSVRNYLAGHSPSASTLARLADVLTAVIRQTEPEAPRLTPNDFFIFVDR